MQKVFKEDGTIEETVIHTNGQVEKKVRRARMDDKMIQTDFSNKEKGGSLEDCLAALGIDAKHLPLIAMQIRKYA